MNDGEMFGKEGAGFMRMNVGCPRVTLEKALQQLKAAYEVTLIHLIIIKRTGVEFHE